MKENAMDWIYMGLGLGLFVLALGLAVFGHKLSGGLTGGLEGDRK